jgi:hypothetical protein
MIKSQSKKWAGHGGDEEFIRILVGKPERRPLGRSRHRWDNIKMHLTRDRMKCMDWSDIDQDTDQWRALVNKTMDLQVPLYVGKFLSS